MAAILTNLRNTIIAGFVLAIVVILILKGGHGGGFSLDHSWWAFFFRWLHVLSGVMWIGLLWYFNFVQIPNMPNIEAAQRPAITKVIAPAALFWFRWAAMSTIATGLILAWLNDYILNAITFGLMSGGVTVSAIGIGMWLGTIMWFNVWFVIWPNQKIALGIEPADDAAKAAAGRTAMLFSRTNTMLSIPMLFCMVFAQNPF